MKPVLMIFIDGVGIGENNSEKNPFFQKSYKIFNEYFGETPHLDNQNISNNDSYLFPVDANLGIDGLPQSGTGQTTIFTGENASGILGRHFGPYPHSELIQTLEEKNIFADLKRKGKKGVFVNAYPRIFFDYINKGRRRLSVTTLSCLLSGIYLKNADDLVEGNALSNEIDNHRWIENLKYKIPYIEPEVAADRLLNLVKLNDFTLFEYFLTDHLGHWRIKESFERITDTLDKFLFHILVNTKDDLTLVICSDHGNFEDISVKTHTRNPAIGITSGFKAENLKNKIFSLSDIKPSILELME